MSVYAFSTAGLTAQQVEDRRKLAAVEFLRSSVSGTARTDAMLGTLNAGGRTMSEISRALGVNLSYVEPLVHGLLDSGEAITLANGTDWKVVRVPSGKEEEAYKWKYAAELVE